MKKVLSFLLVLLVISCSKEGIENVENMSKLIEEESFPIATFGEQTGHPFSMENVLTAYYNLPIETRSSFDLDQIVPTHKYVCFVPTSEDEMDSIQRKNDLDYYQYPLDCEITEGFVGIDNPFMINGFPRYWCVVPNDCPLDAFGCPYVIESELWMPDDPNEVKVKSSDNMSFVMALLNEICYEHGMANPYSVETKASNHYYPGGYVKYYDSVLGLIGVEGMVVEAYTFWHNYKATSLSNGVLNFGSHTFNGSFRYRIKFKRDDFAIRKEDNNSDLEYVTAQVTTPLTQVFSGEYAKYCVIFQAAQRFYYQPIDIPRPPENGFWKACLRLQVFPNTSNGNTVGQHNIEDRWWFLADRPVIKIWGYSAGEENTSDELYGGAIHELAHSMHYNMDKNLYSSIEKRVKESVAFGIQCYLADQRYSSYSANYADDYRLINLYTEIMKDLTDGVKMVYCYDAVDNGGYYLYSGFQSSYYDNISSTYSIPELIEAVRTCTTPLNWYSRILSLYPGRLSTTTDLHTAFHFWFLYED
ncbi:MAG: hypothetical protein J6T22_03170 [Bacteroidales bacterium]|nr:hypothetical protein [Bacteroidales bacterium]